MRTNPITLVLTALGLLTVGCGQDEGRHEWGYAYQPDQAGIDSVGEDEDEDADEDADEDEDADPPEDEGDEDPTDDSSNSESDSADPTSDTAETTGAGTGDPTLDTSGEPDVPEDTMPESPYQGGWDIGTCQGEVDGSIADFRLTDQFGDQVSLYDFCHKAVLLVAGAFW